MIAAERATRTGAKQVGACYLHLALRLAGWPPQLAFISRICSYGESLGVEPAFCPCTSVQFTLAD